MCNKFLFLHVCLQVGREDVFSFPGSKTLLDLLRGEGSGTAEGFCRALAPSPQGQGFRGLAARVALQQGHKVAQLNFLFLHLFLQQGQKVLDAVSVVQGKARDRMREDKDYLRQLGPSLGPLGACAPMVRQRMVRRGNRGWGEVHPAPGEVVEGDS